jgi:hypothetical protein
MAAIQEAAGGQAITESFVRVARARAEQIRKEKEAGRRLTRSVELEGNSTGGTSPPAAITIQR